MQYFHYFSVSFHQPLKVTMTIILLLDIKTSVFLCFQDVLHPVFMLVWNYLYKY